MDRPHPRAIDRAASDVIRGMPARCCVSTKQSSLRRFIKVRFRSRCCCAWREVARIGAISVDYPGSLLDVRHAVREDIHEVERALSLAGAMGYALPSSDDARLLLHDLPRGTAYAFADYVVVHPGATVPARAWFPERNAHSWERCAQADTTWS